MIRKPIEMSNISCQCFRVPSEAIDIEMKRDRRYLSIYRQHFFDSIVAGHHRNE